MKINEIGELRIAAVNPITNDYIPPSDRRKTNRRERSSRELKGDPIFSPRILYMAQSMPWRKSY